MRQKPQIGPVQTQPAAPKPGRLARFFRQAANDAGTYLWPFKITEALKLQKALLPVLVLHYLVQSSTGALFPTAQEYLSENDMDPSIASTLSDRTIRVRERNLWGTLHALNDLPTLAGNVQVALNMLLPAVQAYAIPPLPLGSWVQDNILLNECHVTLPRANVTAKRAISSLTGIPIEQIEHVPVTDREARLAIAFHEFRHCDGKNASDYVVESEADADVYGMWMAGEALHNKNIAEVFFHARALTTGTHDHDNILYLDARKRGVVQPSAEDMMHASQDAFAFLAAYYHVHPKEKPEPADGWDLLKREINPNYEIKKGQGAYIKNTAAFRNILAAEAGRPTSLLSPLARRRIELYIKAAEYFAPSSVKTPAQTPAAPAPPAAV